MPHRGIVLENTIQSTIGISQRPQTQPLKLLHAAIVCVCAVGFGLDLLEMSINNALSAVFSAPPYALSPKVLSWLLASAYIGAVAGAPLAGRIADRKGLQRTLTLVFLWMGTMSLLAALRPNTLWFGSFRLLSGIALGACPPLLIAYLTGIAPPRSRGLLIFWVCGLAYLMPPVGILLIRSLTPLHPWGIEGWRWPFLLAGAAATVVGFAFIWLPESPGWLLVNGHAGRAHAVLERFKRSALLGLPARWFDNKSNDTPTNAAPALQKPTGRRAFRWKLAYVICLSFMQPWISISFQLLTGPMLLKRGYDLNEVLFFVAIATFGPTVGTLFSGFMVDRTDRRISLIAAGALMALALGVFFSVDQRPLVAASVIAFAIGGAIYTPIMTMYTAELFPTSTRASAGSLAWSANRVAAVAVPIVMLPLLASVGSWMVALVASLCLGLAALLAALGPRGAANIDVD